MSPALRVVRLVTLPYKIASSPSSMATSIAARSAATVLKRRPVHTFCRLGASFRPGRSTAWGPGTPGQVTAQVTEDVYDSPTGKTRLIPQGARLIGQYDAQIAFGQTRALLVWT